MPFYDHFSSQPAKYVFVIKQRKCGFRSYVSFVLKNTLKVPYQQVTQKNLSSKFKRKAKAKKHLYGSDGVVTNRPCQPEYLWWRSDLSL